MGDYLPLLFFASLFILMMSGYPVAFTIGGLSLIFGYFTVGLDFFNLLPLRIWGIMTNSVLIAVPLFIFMGVMLERSGLAEELLEAMALLFRRMRGGLAISVIIVGALLAAATGIVGATVVTYLLNKHRLFDLLRLLLPRKLFNNGKRETYRGPRPPAGQDITVLHHGLFFVESLPEPVFK